MTFEEAWPEIKAGKEFRFKLPGDYHWSPWTNKISQGFALSVLDKTEFEVKREPREWTVVGTESHLHMMLEKGERLKRGEVIKVREVIDEN